MATILQPMSTGELLDRTFFVYRKHFVLFVGIVAIPHLFSLAIGITRVAIFGLGSNPAHGILAPILSSLFAGIVSLLAMAASQAATVVAVSDVHLDRPASISASFSAVGTRVFKLMLIMLAVWIAIGFGFVLLIVPGVLLALMWSLVIPVAVLEGKGLNASAKRSAELTKGDRGRIFVVCFLFSVLIYSIAAALQLPAFAVLGILSRGDPAAMTKATTSFLIMNQIMTFIAQCLAGPLLTIALSLIYYDERVRKEAFDLQMLMSAVQGPAAAGTATATPA